MRKLLSLMLLVTAVCLSLSAGMKSFTVLAAEYAESGYIAAEYYDNVNKSLNVYDMAMKLYTTKTPDCGGAGDTTVYSDNFGGIYIDNKGLLNIGVVGLQKIKKDFDNQVIYKPQKFSYNYLSKILSEITLVMLDYDIYSVAVDENLNRVDVCLSEENNISRITELLQQKDIYEKEALNFVLKPNERIVYNANTAYGGDQVNEQFLGIPSGCGTICVNAVDNATGQFGILTNEHVARNVSLYHNGTLFGPLIGQASKSQNSGSVDAAFVPFSNQSNWNTTAYAKSGSTTYTNVRLGAENLIVQGAPVRRLGQITGNTTGTITRKSISETINGIQKTNIIEYSNAGQAGDSGGPVYFDGGGQNLFLIGIHFASTDTIYTQRWGYACRISEVMNALNITPILNGTIFNTTDLANNEIRIDKLVPTIPNNPQSIDISFTIPSQINGRTVTEIGAYAFANQPNITNYIMPASLRTIGISAFENCTKWGSAVHTFTLPDNVTRNGFIRADLKKTG